MMSTPRPPERRITVRDLRYVWPDIVRQLIAGQIFVVYHDKAPLARLLPFRRTRSSTERPAPILFSPASDLAQLFGHQDLARMVGITESTWSAQFQQGQFSVKVLERLTFLATQVNTLKTFLLPTQLRAWFQRSRSELKGWNVIDHLAAPWDKGDRHATLVETLVESALYSATPMPDPSATPERTP